MTRLGRRLRLARTVDEVTLRTLANEIGISAATLLRIEQGKAFDVATWLRLMTWLLADEDED